MTLNVEQLEESLRTKRFGKSIFFKTSVGSTSDWARKLAQEGAAEGTVTVAESQTSGRGRLGRAWASPSGGLWFSVILRPRIDAKQAVKLVFVAGLAVAQVLHEFFGLDAKVRWPNDVLIEGRKVCGILSEMNTSGEAVNYVIMGIGINVNLDPSKDLPRDLRVSATSVRNEIGRQARPEALLGALLERLEMLYGRFVAEGFTSTLSDWKKCADFLGRRVHVEAEGVISSGLAEEVDGEGALILRLASGEGKRFVVGEVLLTTES